MSHAKRPTKAVILAGGMGTRLAEETLLRPKPMVEVGGRPILWHIMKMYSAHGINEFVICLGYKGYMIKEYFIFYQWQRANITVDVRNGGVVVHDTEAEPWKVTLVETGEHTMTAGRVGRVRDYLDTDRPFCLTYGDGVSDVDISASIDFHLSHGKLATVTAVHPPGRFGALDIDGGNSVNRFVEKPPGDGGMINGGFFVMDPKTLDYMVGDNEPLEHKPLTSLSEQDQLMAWRHNGFWQPMDTLRDRHHLEELWNSGKAPWKSWSDGE